MDVKLFSLCKQEVFETEAGKKHILKCVKAFFPECEGFDAFTSQKRMLLAISQSLRAADVVVVAVQSNMYNATKRLLAAALDLKTVKIRSVANELTPLLEKGAIKQTTFDANIRFPQGAEIMPTDSYLNCGFILSSGNQHIVYLPVESPRADEVVYGSLFDFFHSICETNADIPLFKRHAYIIKRTTDKLDENSLKVAFAGAGDVIERLASGINTRHCLTFGESYLNEYSSKDDLIQAARDLKEAQYSQFGVVFSPITNTEDSHRIISVAIADETGTTTFDFRSTPDESNETMLLNCIDKVMLLLWSYENLADNANSDDIETKSDKLLRKALLKAASVAVGATALISIIVALIAK